MQKRLNKNDLDIIQEIEKTFPQVYELGSIQKDYKQNPFTNYIYVMDNSKIIAVMNYTLMYDRIELNQINVIESNQNKKIASSLIEELINEAKNQRIVNITLEVSEKNKKAIHLYQKYGFVEVAKRKGYYQGIDGILMEKEMIK